MTIWNVLLFFTTTIEEVIIVIFVHDSGAISPITNACTRTLTTHTQVHIQACSWLLYIGSGIFFQNSLVADPQVAVRVAYAESLASLAETSQRCVCVRVRVRVCVCVISYNINICVLWLEFFVCICVHKSHWYSHDISYTHL